ncbi:hypothetical protein BLNAU_7002 [Blattamonas nauphoetae]|uniref:Uncharacterized protein n=1 Tax=Blattamonas nauphoetae TaxID=2049346 RepID=A0ABQ9Y2V9_9EUKA|nr:hypothetical protein BLNAU_7002 [Blattamonas nauphoetae]
MGPISSGVGFEVGVGETEEEKDRNVEIVESGGTSWGEALTATRTDETHPLSTGDLPVDEWGLPIMYPVIPQSTSPPVEIWVDQSNASPPLNPIIAEAVENESKTTTPTSTPTSTPTVKKTTHGKSMSLRIQSRVSKPLDRSPPLDALRLPETSIPRIGTEVGVEQESTVSSEDVKRLSRSVIDEKEEEKGRMVDEKGTRELGEETEIVGQIVKEEPGEVELRETETAAMGRTATSTTTTMTMSKNEKKKVRKKRKNNENEKSEKDDESDSWKEKKENGKNDSEWITIPSKPKAKKENKGKQVQNHVEKGDAKTSLLPRQTTQHDAQPPTKGNVKQEDGKKPLLNGSPSVGVGVNGEELTE